MAGLEDSGSGRASGRGRAVGHQRYQLPAEDPEQLQTGLFPSLVGPVEVGADGLPTGVELEEPADEEGSGGGAGLIDLAPDFQRRAGIWTDVQQSRLIESLLLRIPISSFHMAQSRRGRPAGTPRS